MLARTCAQALLFLVLACGLSFAYEDNDAKWMPHGELVNLIPGKYVLAVFTDAEPEGTLDKDGYMRSLERLQQATDARVIQMAIYDKGKKPGQGVRAVAELILGQEEPTLPFTEALGERTSYSFEKYMAYTIPPDELFTAYADKPEEAEKLYRGHPLILDMPYTQGIELDARERPTIHIQGEGSDMLDIVIRLDPDDPFLPNIRQGSSVIVRGFARGYERPSVIMEAEVIMLDGETRPE